jgi:serine/threonine protein kinase
MKLLSLYNHDTDKAISIPQAGEAAVQDIYDVPQNTQQHIQSIGTYDLLRLLGQGTASEVYLGKHRKLHTYAAIKVQRGFWSENDVRKFLARASVLTHLQHQHIIQVLDFGIENHTAYLAMEYAPHGTLRQRHPKGSRVPLPLVVSYVQQVAAALDYVHQHNLIHRDVKPHNLLLGTNERVLLSDFGIAVVSQSLAPDHPAFHDFEGTAPYAAPEQLIGKPRRNSDQYSLGITVYEWLCGEWPFSGTFDEIVQQHLFEPVPSLCSKDDTITPAIEQVVLKALAKDPNERFPSILAFAAALTEASREACHRLTSLTRGKHALSTPAPISTPKRQFRSSLPFPGHLPETPLP